MSGSRRKRAGPGLAGLLALCALLQACSFAPTYKVPAISAPQAWKESAGWQLARPADQLTRGPWWQMFADTTLNTLEAQALQANPTLAAALAHYEGERQLLVQTRASLFPSISVQGSMNRNRQSDTRPLRGANQPDVYNADTLGLGMDYELDLWGEVRNRVSAGVAETQAAAADLENVRLSLQAQVARDYIALRGLDHQAQLLREAVENYARALHLIQLRHDEGIASGLDVGRAQTQLNSARASLQSALGQRALYEHGLAVLLGQSPANFTLGVALEPLQIPQVPTGVPAGLLQRRPDIAAAERRMAAANARIGVAKAAFFPLIDIDAGGGYQSTNAVRWLTQPNSFWSLGPSALLTVFDAGARLAQVEQARQRYIEASAQYRAQVLASFAQVEDQLALLHHFADEDIDRVAARKAATQVESLAMIRYREGAVNYLDVVTAQTTALQARQDEQDLRTQRLQASVRLIRALGGGWSRPSALASP